MILNSKGEPAENKEPANTGTQRQEALGGRQKQMTPKRKEEETQEGGDLTTTDQTITTLHTHTHTHGHRPKRQDEQHRNTKHELEKM